MLTTCIFKKPLYSGVIVASHENFKLSVMVEIDLLHPNQLNLDNEVVNKKRKNSKLCSTLYVVYQNGDFILIDGHHTIAAKILNGIKKVKVLIYAPTNNN